MCLPEADLRNEILDHISASTEAHFKSQQIGEPELTVTEKRSIAENILNKSTSLFLSRFGQYLNHEHFELFKACDEEDQYVVSHFLKEYEKKNSRENQKLVRNRRFEAMNQMIKEGSYFTETEMKSRNPLLYEHLVGQYLTPEEKEDTDRVDTTNITFVNLLLHQIDRDNEESLKQAQMEKEKLDPLEDDVSKRNLMALRKNLHDQSEIEYDTSDEEDNVSNKRSNRPILDTCNDDVKPCTSLWGEEMTDEPLSTPVGIERTPWATSSSSKFANREVKAQPFVELSDREKSLLLEEFRTHMFTNFLEGKEKLFDYSKVDLNPAYDNLLEKSQDAEDHYFDEDESSNSDMQVDNDRSKHNSHSDSGDELDAFMNDLKPEIIMQDINSKIKHL